MLAIGMLALLALFFALFLGFVRFCEGVVVPAAAPGKGARR